MKKITTFFTVILILVSFVSCGKKIDSSGWLSNLEDGKKAAKDEGKRIFLFFNTEDDRKIFGSEDFIAGLTEKYVLVNIDCSESLEASELERLEESYKIAELYGAQRMPYFLVLSPEGYVITELFFDEDSDIVEAQKVFDEAEPEIERFEENLAKIKSGTKEERLAAIDEIFDNTEISVVHHLSPLNKLYLSLDKENANGQYLKHIIALTRAKAVEHFLENEIEKASEEFAELAKDKNLTDEDKQMALYTAGHFLAQSGSGDFEKIRDYFQQSYDACPDSENAQNIKLALDYVQMIVDGAFDENAETEAETEAETSGAQ